MEPSRLNASAGLSGFGNPEGKIDVLGCGDIGSDLVEMVVEIDTMDCFRRSRCGVCSASDSDAPELASLSRPLRRGFDNIKLGCSAIMSSSSSERGPPEISVCTVVLYCEMADTAAFSTAGRIEGPGRRGRGTISAHFAIQRGPEVYCFWTLLPISANFRSSKTIKCLREAISFNW